MKRVIKNIASIDDDLRERLEDQYPNGIRREDLISFPTPQGRRLYGIELQTGEVNYLIRIPSIDSLSERGRGPRVDYLLKRTESFEEE